MKLENTQIPKNTHAADGRENFIGALIVAGSLVIPEVCLYFASKLFRGNRATKSDNSALNAFSSPNMNPLALMEISIRVDWDAVFRPAGAQPFRVVTSMSSRVAVLNLVPNITAETVNAYVDGPLDGIVLQ